MRTIVTIKNTFIYLGILFSGLTFFTSCETEFIPENVNLEPEVVVEGYIELGDDALPPYVILTKSKPFFTSLDSNAINNIFVKGADVRIQYKGLDIKLSEFCLNDLPPNIREQVADRLGINADSLSTNLCAYVDLLNKVIPEAGVSYTLKVKSSVYNVTAVTTIPIYVPLDTLWWKEAPGKPSDTLLQLLTSISDPANEVNFYRYFCKINDGEFRTAFNSVYDDPLINGKKFDFRIIKPNSPGQDFDQSTFGLYRIGDSVAIKWSTIDKAHFDFWTTYEFNRGSQGPFSTYTTINTNIKGGLGNWGGYNSKVYRLKVKR